jgi:Holliday junction DNA helicase RuvA
VIGRLRGVVAEVGEEDALIDVGGVGYVVRCGAKTLAHLPAPGDEALLHVETQWTEAAGIRLYGFLAREDRRAFLLLLNIQGVGPKAALSVLDVLPPAELAAAVAREDKALVGRAQGVGPKLAQRIVTELAGKPISDAPAAAFHATASHAPAPPSAAG